MSWKHFLGCRSAAERTYQRTVAIEMFAYVVILFGVKHFVLHHQGPLGKQLYFLAALPSFPIVGVLIAVGVYLRREKDEYQRDTMVKCMLWAMAVVLSVSAYLSFLSTFGGAVSLPVFFYEFVLFWVVMAVAKVGYSLSDRARDDE